MPSTSVLNIPFNQQPRKSTAIMYLPPALFATAFALVLLLPPVVAAYGTAFGLLAPYLAPLLRLAPVVAIAALSAPGGRLSEHVLHRPLHTLIVGLMALHIVLSLTLNPVSAAALVKALAQMAFVICVVLLLPRRLEAMATEHHFRAICIAFVVVAFTVVFANLIFQFLLNHPDRLNVRLVHPFNVGDYTLLAWILSAFVLRNPAATCFFAAATLCTGSRVAILPFLFLLPVVALLHRPPPWRVFAGCLAVLALTLIYGYAAEQNRIMHPTSPESRAQQRRAGDSASAGKALRETGQKPDLRAAAKTLQRPANITSSSYTPTRFLIWKRALSQLVQDSQTLWFGYGREYRVTRKNGSAPSTHNTFLRHALTYGIAYAVMTHLLWFICFMPRIPTLRLKPLLGYFRSHPIAAAQLAVFATITALSLVQNIFWTNLATPVTLAAVVLLMMRPLHLSSAVEAP